MILRSKSRVVSDVPHIVTSTQELLLYLLPQIAKFPRSHRFQLGQRMEVLAYEVLEELITAYYSREKSNRLRNINIRMEQLRFYLRLSKDLKLLSVQKYEVSSRLLNAIGMQLGGWIRQQEHSHATT